MHYTINLSAVDSYEIDGRTIVTKDGNRTSRYVLPSGARINLWRNKDELTGRLEIGGFKTVTVGVTGPLDVLDPLFTFLAS